MEGGPCPLCLELEGFDREYQAILVGLAEQRRGILERINQRHDPFIQRFPTELASQVFAFCLPQQASFDSNPLFTPLLWDELKDSFITPFNILLGSICRSWRRIAWPTPNLWSTLPIRLHQFDKQNRVDLTLEWLGRSALIPLDVVVAYDAKMTLKELKEENVDRWKPLMDIANGCSSRWRILNVDVPELVHSYIVGNDEATSILECLKVGDTYTNQRFSTGFSLTDSLPMPSKLVSSTLPLRSIIIGWSNLTSVRINDTFLDECLVLLQRACRLTTFVIDSDGLSSGRDESLPAPSPTIHRTLQRLDIFEILETQTAAQFLDFLTLPSLVDLSYDSEYNSLDNVLAFLQRSCCILTALYIMTNDDLNHFSRLVLASQAGLQSLENLVYHGDVDGLLPFLNRPPNEQDGSMFLPNLHSIEIWDDQKAWSGLADLFLSRPLNSLSIHLQTYINRKDDIWWVDKETALRFHDLIEIGRDIKIMGRLQGDSGEIRDLLPWFIKARMSETRNTD